MRKHKHQKYQILYKDEWESYMSLEGYEVEEPKGLEQKVNKKRHRTFFNPKTQPN